MWPEVWRDYVDLAAGGGVRVRPRAARDENRSRPDSPERPVFRVTARALVGAYAGAHEVAGDCDEFGSPERAFVSGSLS